MTKDEFDKLYLYKVVRCDTEEKANHFLALADSIGYKWGSSKSLTEDNEWGKFKKETCYHITKEGILFDNTNYYNMYGYQVIEYKPQLKFELGDKVRVKNAILFKGRVGIVVKLNSPSPMPYGVKFDDEVWFWFLSENDLEKVEEPTCKEKTINNIIKEIKENQKRITALLNRLEQEVKK